MVLGKVVGGIVIGAFLPDLVINPRPIQIFDCSAVAVDVFDYILTVLNEIC